MEYVRLGTTGLKVLALLPWDDDLRHARSGGRGCSTKPRAGRSSAARSKRGINFFDTADMYSRGASEEVLGRALKEFARRDQVVIATKVFYPIGRRPERRAASRASTSSTRSTHRSRRLGTDYVDLYQIHRFDLDTPIEETLEALHDVVKAGKARYIGASSMCAWQFAKMLYTADAHGWTRFVSMQNHYNLVYREEEREMLPLCREEGIGVIPWSPLARGFLAGNRQQRRSRRHGAREDRRIRASAVLQRRRLRRSSIASSSWRSGAASSRRRSRWRGCSPSPASPRRSSARRSRRTSTMPSARWTSTCRRRDTTLEEPYQPHPVLGIRDLLPVVRRAPAPEFPPDLGRGSFCRSPAR